MLSSVQEAEKQTENRLGSALDTLRLVLMCALFLVFLCSAAGAPTGTLCGEPSAPLRRCQQPLLFPKNPQPELTTIHNSGAAMIWNQRQEVALIKADWSSQCTD